MFAAIDSLRVYSFTQADHGGAYDSALSRTNGALPRLVIALIVVVVALVGVLRAPARPRSRPGASCRSPCCWLPLRSSSPPSPC